MNKIMPLDSCFKMSVVTSVFLVFHSFSGSPLQDNDFGHAFASFKLLVYLT